MIIIVTLLALSIIGLIIHGNPPVHYYVTVAPLITIFAAYVIGKFKINIILIIILVLVLNYKFYVSDSGFNRHGNYDKQVEVVKEIIKAADGKKFNLKRVGDFDYYSDNYSQNYMYLLWMYGNEPVKDKQVLIYTIYDKDNNIYFK